MKSEWLIFPLALLIVFGTESCSPKIIEHYSTVRDTTYIKQFERDSIYFRDSIYVQQKNDTIYQYVEKWRTKYIQKTDTIYQAVRDTTIITTTVEVPRKKGWWDKTKDYAIWALLAGIIVAYRKQIFKLLKLL